MKFKDIRTIYFDYDGTIHDCIKIYAPAFRKAYEFLVENNEAAPRQWKNEEIQEWLGYTSKSMWESFMKDLESSIKNEASFIIGEEMKRQISSGSAKLYDGALEVLEQLKARGYNLVFLSNCSIDYMEESSKAFNLRYYFSDIICSEMYGYIPKHEILQKIKNNYQAKQAIVGDRFHDMESGVNNNIETVFCQYGYGHESEGDCAAVRIGDIKEILWHFC